MAQEMDGKDTRPGAPEEGRSEEHLTSSEGTAQESIENDKDYGFLKYLVRHARLALQKHSSAIVDGFAARSVGGSIQHAKMLLGMAGVKDVSKLSAEGNASSGSYLTARLFCELIGLRPGPGPDGDDVESSKPLKGQPEEDDTDRFNKDVESGL